MSPRTPHSPLANPVGVGIVGLGFMAATHLKAYRQIEGYRIAALCNPSGRNLDGDFSKVGGNVGSTEPLKLDMSRVKAYRSFADLLADPAVQLVDICAPTHTHPELAIAALRARKHVLCEKPLARTAELAREIAGGASVSAEGSWAMTEGFGFNMSFTVNFENATADYDLARGADALKLFEKGQEPRTLKPEGKDGYVGELKYLLECIRSGRPPSVVTARDGVSAVEICEAEERSVKAGTIIIIPGNPPARPRNSKRSTAP